MDFKEICIKDCLLVKHKSAHSCESVIFFQLGDELILMKWNHWLHVLNPRDIIVMIAGLNMIMACFILN